MSDISGIDPKSFKTDGVIIRKRSLINQIPSLPKNIKVTNSLKLIVNRESTLSGE